MKQLKPQSLAILAAVVFSVQASYAADSLAPAGYQTANYGTELSIAADAVAAPSSIIVASSPVMDASVASADAVSILNNSSQDFAAALSSPGQNNNPGSPEPMVIPEPTTLALTGFCGLAALIFMRRLGKANRA